MIFISFWFIAFALALFPVYWAVRLPRLRLAVLAFGCVIFHTQFAGVAGVIPIIVLGTVTYCIGLSRNRILCTIGMVICATALVFYKYTAFVTISIVGAIAPEAGQMLFEMARQFRPVTPPLGISFFVFEFVHYLFEVRRGSMPITHPLHFGMFAIFWPSLVAGPIKRYQKFIPSLFDALESVAARDVVLGAIQVTTGLVKKALADDLTIWINANDQSFGTQDIWWRWLFFVLLALRIYWDFSGYSDIAIGYARMFGVRLPQNFNWPYVARSLTDFWNRWHISLSSWIRDYIYIPIGGSRHGLARKVANAAFAFAVCGLWHGADWNFLLWGLYHGLGLGISGNYERALGRPGRWMAAAFHRAPLLGSVVTFLFVGFGWLVFFYPVSTALEMARQLVGLT